jgi:hypothetical protein
MFEHYFPQHHAAVVVTDKEGKEHHMLVPHQLALLVPQKSPFYDLMRNNAQYGGGVTGGRNTFSLLWNATRHPLSVPIVVADEFCVDELFHLELGRKTARSNNNGENVKIETNLDLELDKESGGEGGGGAGREEWLWHKPVLRNYW